MLQNIRNKITGPTALVFLALIAIPFIFVGISSPLIGSGYAAKVDGDEISINVFEQAWQDQIRQNPDYLNYPPQFQNMLRTQILDRLIRDRLIIGYMNNVGMRISDEMVTEQVQQIRAFQDNGVFTMEPIALHSTCRDGALMSLKRPWSNRCDSFKCSKRSSARHL